VMMRNESHASIHGVGTCWRSIWADLVQPEAGGLTGRAHGPTASPR
jgi:hypothetical protein